MGSAQRNELGVRLESGAVAKAKEHVELAAEILKSLGPDLARVAWLLEDTLLYIDEAAMETGEKVRDALTSKDVGSGATDGETKISNA